MNTNYRQQRPVLIELHWSATNDYVLIDYPVVDVMVKEMIFKGGHKSQHTCRTKHCMNYCIYKAVTESSNLSACQAASVT